MTSPEMLRAHRSNPSVLKAELAKLRERSPCAIVVVIEGKEDLPVYEVWFKRIIDDFLWEPILSSGKKNLLEFRELVHRDMTGMKACTYFIVDHDYDGLRGFAGGDDIYVLPAYSVENYLADESSFESFLRADLHVVGDPALRATLLEKFESLRVQFLDAMLGACIKLYGAKNESVGNVQIDDGVGAIVDVGLHGVTVYPEKSSQDLVRTDREISSAGIDSGLDFFASSDKRLWIRGKFLLVFFKSACNLFFEDRRAPNPTLFSGTASNLAFTPGSLDFRSLAGRSRVPAGLREVASSWMERCRKEC